VATMALREQLKILQFWSLEVCFLIAVVLAALALRELWRTLDRVDVSRMTAVVIVAIGLTLFVAPRTSRIYYDEQIYQSIGQNLSDMKRAQMCNDGTVEYGRLRCWLGEYNKQPYAFPHLLSVAFRLFGVAEGVAFAVNAIVMALTVCGVYLLVLIAFEDRAASLFAALTLALIPHQILWSATSAAEPSASLACLASVLFAACFLRFRSTISLAATGVVTAYAVQFRPECLLIVPVVALVAWPAVWSELTRRRIWLTAVAVSLLLVVHIAHLYAVRNEGWGTTDARLSLAYVGLNLAVNGPFYLGDERFPVVFTALAIAGVIAARSRTTLAIAAYFALFFGMYLLFYAGSYNYGADVRYSVLTYPPISILAGLGASRLAGWVATVQPRIPATRVMTLALMAQFLWYAPIVRATTEEAWAARADVRFARAMAPALTGNSYVLTHNPGMFQVWKVNAGQLSTIVANPRQLDFLLSRYTGGVYIHWNFWCNVQDPVQQEFCQRALAAHTVELWQEHRERDQRFAFYRVVRREPPISPQVP
jgi:hypothetical protein